MSDGGAPERLLETIAKRRGVLAAVADGPVHVRDLCDDPGIARSTAYEATRELEEAGLLARGDGGLELTPLGRNAVAVYDESLAALDTLCAVRAELDGVGAGATLAPILRHATEVVRAAPHTPDRPFEAVGEFFDGAARMKGFAPVTGKRYVAGLDEALGAGQFEIELLTEASVIEYLLANHRDALDRWVASADVRLYETTASLPYGLLVAEEPTPAVGVLLYDGSGQLRALLATEHRAAVGWGRERFEARLASATELTSAVAVEDG